MIVSISHDSLNFMIRTQNRTEHKNNFTHPNMDEISRICHWRIANKGSTYIYFDDENIEDVNDSESVDLNVKL